MKILFVHNARFVCTSDGDVFTRGMLPYKIWERYLRHCDNFTVVCRMSNCTKAPI